MRRNPTKCTFGVTSEKFLGFLITQREIKANPDKIRAVIDMGHPTNKKQVQEFTGRIASLSRFISGSTEKCLPFFKTLRQSDRFWWSDEYRSAFEALKEYLKTPSLLAKPVEGDPLYLYLSVSDEAVKYVLIWIEENNQQRPVYYISKVLHDVETRYPKTQKLAYSLI